MRSIIGIAVALSAIAWLSPSAHGHGGTFPGPVGEGTPPVVGPPGMGTPGTTPGGHSGSGNGSGTTPGNNGGVTGGASGGGPTGPGLRPGARSGNGNRSSFGRTTGRRKKGGSNRLRDWDFWWDLNDDAFLDLKRKVLNPRTASPGGTRWLGGKAEAVAGMTQRLIAKEVLPALSLALEDPYFDARSGAAIALGKVARADQEEVLDRLRARLRDSHNTVREAACLGLALSGSRSVVPLLLEIAEDSPAGRKALGRATVLNRTRAFASVALGLVGHRAAYTVDEGVIARLSALARRRDVADPDLQVAPTIALGLVKCDESIMALRKIFQDQNLPDVVRAHAANGLGKLGARSATKLLLPGFGDRSNHVKRSCAIALGLLGDADNRSIIRTLMAQAKDSPDRATRNFAIIALGRIGGGEAQAFLSRFLRSGQVHDRSFAALALGVSSFGKTAPPAIQKALIESYRRCRSRSERGAYAIALALAGCRDEIPAMIADLNSERGGQSFRGHLCTALGLLDVQEAIPTIRELSFQRGDLDMRKRAAIALGLLRDTGAVEVLEKVIQESGASKALLGAATVALGHIGDRRAVPILVNMLRMQENGSYRKDTTRAFATVALGFLGDKDELPLLSELHRATNSLAPTASLLELLTIL